MKPAIKLRHMANVPGSPLEFVSTKEVSAGEVFFSEKDVVNEFLKQFKKDGTKDWPQWMKDSAYFSTANFPKRNKP